MALHSLFDHGGAPSLTSGDNNDSALTVGMLWDSSDDGAVTSIWIYVGNTSMDGLSGTALIYEGGGYGDPPGNLLKQQAFTFQANVGWQEIVLSSSQSITADDLYIVAIHFSEGHYASSTNGFTSEVTSGPLTARSGGGTPYDLGNGRYEYGASPAYPQERSGNLSNYWIDVTFDDTVIVPPDVDVSVSSSDDTPDTNTDVTLTATPANGTNYTYDWSVVRGSGTFEDDTAAATDYTPTVAGKHIIKCVVTATEGTASGTVTLTVADPVAASSPTFTADVTDPLLATDQLITNFNVQRGGVPTMQRRSLYGNRLSFGDAVTNTTPLIEPSADNPATYAVRVYLQRNCWLTGMRFLKAPLAEGDHTVVVWQFGNTTPLISKVVTLSVTADPVWIDVTFDEHLALTASDTVPYLIGYHAPDGHSMFAQWTYGSQVTVEYPFLIGRNGGGFGENDGTGRAYGSTPTYPTTWWGHSYFIDPIVEWESDDVVYEGGLEYMQRYKTYEDIDYFPIGIWQIQSSSVPVAASLGINTVITMFSNADDLQANKDAMVAANMDVYVQAELGDTTFLGQLMTETAFYERVKGFLIRDEPDLIAPFDAPNTLQNFYTELRKYDATKMIIFNFGWTPVKNKGFAYQPPSATIKQVNQYWRDYARITDIISCDFYMEDSRNLDGDTYGLWCNPRMIRRLQDLSDKTRPVWHYISTAATPDNQPTPTLVNRSVWASLIGGARGIVFFDYTFTASNQYVTDFTMGTNSSMANMVQALTTLIQSLKGPLLAPESSLPVSVDSSNTSEGPIGGEWGVPIHYAIREHGGNTYLFTQSIRPGTTTATFTVPAAANKTITVLNESRTLNADGSGVFSDSFSSDYEVHLYRWT